MPDCGPPATSTSRGPTLPRRRFGVALLLPEPATTEIQGLRRALADPALDRIAPHITLVPPVNVATEDVDRALGVVRAAARSVGPLGLTLGPGATFHPDAPVIHLSVSGDGAELRTLRDAVFEAPLARPLSWTFVPHVTVATEFPTETIIEATRTLAGYQVEVLVERVHLLEEQRDDDGARVWRPVADAVLGPERVVGRGPLEVDLAEAAQLDPEARAFADREWDRFDEAVFGERDEDDERVTITARRDGVVVGIATGMVGPGRGYLADLLVAETHRREGVGSKLLAAFEAACRERGARSLNLRTAAGTAAETVYRRRGWTEESRHPDWRHGHEFVGYRKWLG